VARAIPKLRTAVMVTASAITIGRCAAREMR
jgi:hypothetical protein